MSKAKELMDKIAAEVIASIEAGIPAGKWTKPWAGEGGLAMNAVTKKQYSGGNLVWLWILQETGDHETGQWATYKQWESIGAQVRKGEKGYQLIKWLQRQCKDHGPEEMCHSCGQMRPNVFTVFNADQVDGYEPGPKVILSPDERIANAEAFFAALGSDVRHTDEASAYYDRAKDRITMPHFETFKTVEGYYGTLGHEHIHWTGAKSRLDREFGKRFGDDAYAVEELVAELGAAMLCGHLGITDSPRPDHAQYLAHWAAMVNAESKVLWTAASKASAAVTYLTEKADRAQTQAPEEALNA